MCVTRMYTHTVHMALMRYFIVFSFVTKPGQTLEFLLRGTIVPLNFLAGYYCSIVASTPQPTVYASISTCISTCAHRGPSSRSWVLLMQLLARKISLAGFFGNQPNLHTKCMHFGWRSALYGWAKISDRQLGEMCWYMSVLVVNFEIFLFRPTVHVCSDLLKACC